MFDELAERSLMSPLAGMKHTYVRLAIITHNCTFFKLLAIVLHIWKHLAIGMKKLRSYYRAKENIHFGTKYRITRMDEKIFALEIIWQ